MSSPPSSLSDWQRLAQQFDHAAPTAASLQARRLFLDALHTAAIKRPQLALFPLLAELCPRWLQALPALADEFFYSAWAHACACTGKSTQAAELMQRALACHTPPAPPPTGVVALSLFGQKPVYCEGAIVNAARMPHIYPGYRLLVYHDHSVPQHCLQRLRGHGARLVDVCAQPELRSLPPTFWRFLALEEDADVVLLRDADSIIDAREQTLVSHWLQRPDKPFHIIRDWYTHTYPILAGMWGARGRWLPDIRPRMLHYVATHPQLDAKHGDQQFLADCIWPRIQHLYVHHCSVAPVAGSSWPPELPVPRDCGEGMGARNACTVHLQPPLGQHKLIAELLHNGQPIARYQHPAGTQPLEFPACYKPLLDQGIYTLQLRRDDG